MPVLEPVVASNLTSLGLVNNSITAIQYNYFLHFTRLSILNIQYNRLTELGEFSLTGLVSLTTLNLAFNRFT